MTKVWSWEAEDFIGEDEPAEYLVVVVAQACDVCGLPHTSENPVVFACYACGNVTHVQCGSDTEPSGGYDRDPDENYWLCTVCLSDCEAADSASLTVPNDIPVGVDPFDSLYEFPAQQKASPPCLPAPDSL